ncbi:MAG: histidine kinase [Saprospiraceae bacterium]|nr:histidine kinase [Saprospiraceae bacterium]
MSEDLNALRIRAHNLEKEKAQMMFDNLKQQLNPHFLFNSLTSLSALINLDQV